MSETETRLYADDYVEILEGLGGRATTGEIADIADRDNSTVTRTLGGAVDRGDIDRVKRIPLGDGNPDIYQIEEPEEDSDD